MESINLKKLAQELGLSFSTVSRALRDSHEISQKTKDRVKELADKLGYEPNPHASSLRKSKSKTIAVIIPEIENTFFSQAMNGVELIAQQKGYHVLVYLTHENFIREEGILQLLRNGRVDGLLISVSDTTINFTHLEALQKKGLPIVFFDRVCEEIDAPKITTDDTDASYTATDHLVKRGCKKIAFLSMSNNLSISKRRQSGYIKALEENKIADWQQVTECGADEEKNRVLIRNLLQQKDAPDGIFAAVEKFAINTYEVCNELNIAIPGKLKVISFSNLSSAALFNPSLSTIVQPAYNIGREAVTILFKLIEDKKLFPSERKVIMPSQLVARGSTA